MFKKVFALLFLTLLVSSSGLCESRYDNTSVGEKWDLTSFISHSSGLNSAFIYFKWEDESRWRGISILPGYKSHSAKYSNGNSRVDFAASFTIQQEKGFQIRYSASLPNGSTVNNYHTFNVTEGAGGTSGTTGGFTNSGNQSSSQSVQLGQNIILTGHQQHSDGIARSYMLWRPIGTTNWKGISILPGVSDYAIDFSLSNRRVDFSVNFSIESEPGVEIRLVTYTKKSLRLETFHTYSVSTSNNDHTFLECSMRCDGKNIPYYEGETSGNDAAYYSLDWTPSASDAAQCLAVLPAPNSITPVRAGITALSLETSQSNANERLEKRIRSLKRKLRQMKRICR